MLDATVEGSPDCCSPAEIEANHTISMSEGSSEMAQSAAEKEVIIADVGRMEQDLWNREPLVVHHKGLYTLFERFAWLTDSAGPVGGVVRKYVLLNNGVTTWARAGAIAVSEQDAISDQRNEEHVSEDLPTRFKVPSEILGNETTSFLDLIHYVCFFHHVPLAIRDGFFQVVC